MRLVLRSDPIPDESFPAYLLRLSEFNGYARPSQLIGNPLDAKSMYKTDLLSKLGSRSLSHNDFHYWKSENEHFFRLQDDPIDDWHILQRFPRVCPLCLRSKNHLSDLWDITLACACPHHGVHLIGKCPMCTAQIQWDRNSRFHCHKCKFDFRLSSAPKAPEYLVSFSALLANKLGHCFDYVESRTLRVLARASAASILEIVYFFGNCNARKQSQAPRVIRNLTILAQSSALAEVLSSDLLNILHHHPRTREASLFVEHVKTMRTALHIMNERIL